jgi:ubiquinone/menaquinone biosynthesis C-methylase UbiE
MESRRKTAELGQSGANSAAPRVRGAYDASRVVFRALRACGWGTLLNFGYHRFGRPFTLLNFVLAPELLTPYYRLATAQMRLVKRSVSLLRLPASERTRVLDVGCGRGTSSFVMASVCPNASVTGLDLLPENMHVAQTLYRNTPNLRFLRGDAHELPFPAASFDRLLCLEAAFQFRDRNRFLQQMAHVLAPGGRAVIVDFMWRQEEDRQIWEHEPTRLVRKIWEWENFDSVERYSSNAEANGFRVEARHDWSAHVTAPLVTLLSTALPLSRTSWTLRFLKLYVPLLSSFSAEEWAELRRQGAAHAYVARHVRYVALVLQRQPAS